MPGKETRSVGRAKAVAGFKLKRFAIYAHRRRRSKKPTRIRKAETDFGAGKHLGRRGHTDPLQVCRHDKLCLARQRRFINDRFVNRPLTPLGRNPGVER